MGCPQIVPSIEATGCDRLRPRFDNPPPEDVTGGEAVVINAIRIVNSRWDIRKLK